MLSCEIDHLVVTAPSLEAGADFIRQALGVEMQPGGKHGRMGTHNLLLGLGPSCYLEVIAIDPSAPAPQRPRWFGLDTYEQSEEPRLSTWVARTADIRAVAAASTEPLGDVTTMSRDQLSWQITIPDNGVPPLGGVAPALIAWPPGVHPASSLRDQGLRLVDLRLVHPDLPRLKQLLVAINCAGPLSFAAGSAATPPGLVATIATSSGQRVLGVPLP